MANRLILCFLVASFGCDSTALPDARPVTDRAVERDTVNTPDTIVSTMCSTALPCPMGESCCEGFCTTLTTSADNCGACGRSCGDTADTCSFGQCLCGESAVCGASESCCGGGCIDKNTNSDNCGGCGVVCGVGSVCEAGACRMLACPTACEGDAVCNESTMACECNGVVCAAGSTCCGDTCVDLTSDKANCNECGTQCQGIQQCSEGACVDCGAQAGDPCCGGANECLLPSLTCEGGSCVECGAGGEDCCMGNTCDGAGLHCVDSRCSSCGELGERGCLPDNSCAAGFRFNPNTGFCEICGMENQPCCAANPRCGGGVFNNLECQGTVCRRREGGN